MATKVSTNSFLPNYTGNIAAWAPDFIQSIIDALNRFATRINLALPEDGSEAMTNPLVLVSYTVAGLPSAASWAGGIVYVSNGTSNKRLAVSDGTNWRFPDGNVVS